MFQAKNVELMIERANLIDICPSEITTSIRNKLTFSEENIAKHFMINNSESSTTG